MRFCRAGVRKCMKGKGLEQAHWSREIVRAWRDTIADLGDHLVVPPNSTLNSHRSTRRSAPLCLSILPSGGLPVCPTYAVLRRYCYLQRFARSLLAKSALALDALVLELLPGGGEKNGQRRFD